MPYSITNHNNHYVRALWHANQLHLINTPEPVGKSILDGSSPAANDDGTYPTEGDVTK